MVTWLKIFKLNDSTKKLGQVVLSQVTGNQSQLSTRNIVEVHVTHFGKPVAHGFVIFLQESWMIKTCTGSQEVQQLWQTVAIFQHIKTLVRI